ncbi:hypothetical protein BpHYR1_037301 [Brachionus plicatilis]|uniref:Uncharacterized protein n=1 Tax=Brachionus plicatilis TaxID=10195 RepID=A0A3M7RXT8_BRAPC|nr:hypothetical protein BpHYR1_037301 [Brachionus plicatilis]
MPVSLADKLLSSTDDSSNVSSKSIIFLRSRKIKITNFRRHYPEFVKNSYLEKISVKNLIKLRDSKFFNFKRRDCLLKCEIKTANALENILHWDLSFIRILITKLCNTFCTKFHKSNNTIVNLLECYIIKKFKIN